MTQKLKLLLLMTIFGTLTGCGNNDKDKNLVNEFVSLDQKPNVEYGVLTIEGKKINLSYSGALMKKGDYIGLIGLFSEERKVQIAAITSDDGLMPSKGGLIINIPDIPNGYLCEDFSIVEGVSKKIKDSQVMDITADACIGRGENSGKTVNVKLHLTESMFGAGSSRIMIKGDKAYLDTEYTLYKDTTLNGGLGTRTYNQIFDLIHQHPEVKTLVEGKVSGSINDAINMQTGRLVRKAGFATHITKNSDIASGGVDLFCAGVKRTMENGAKVGVHSWSGDGVEAGNLPDDSPLHKDQINYFTEMLGDPAGREFYFYTIHVAPSDSIHQMSRSEMELYHLLTE